MSLHILYYLHTRIVVILWLNFYLCFNWLNLYIFLSNLISSMGKGESESNNKLDQQMQGNLQWLLSSEEDVH